MKVTYVGSGITPPTQTTNFGIEFKMNIPVEVEDEKILAKLNGHPCFIVGAKDVAMLDGEGIEEKDDDLGEQIDEALVSYHDMVAALKEAGVKPASRKAEDVEAAYLELA